MFIVASARTALARSAPSAAALETAATSSTSDFRFLNQPNIKWSPALRFQASLVVYLG
jgi:hypothetical protein